MLLLSHIIARSCQFLYSREKSQLGLSTSNGSYHLLRTKYTNCTAWTKQLQTESSSDQQLALRKAMQSSVLHVLPYLPQLAADRHAWEDSGLLWILQQCDCQKWFCSYHKAFGVHETDASSASAKNL